MTKNYALNRNRYGKVTRNLSYWAKLKTAATFLLLMLLFMGTGSRLHAQDWDQIIKTTASDRAADDLFGYSVSISGDYAIVGASREDEDASGGNTIDRSGSAYIFKNIDGVWTQHQKIVASDRAAVDWFGYSVCISGDYAIVGAQYEDEDASGGNTIDRAGSAYIFYNNGTTWEEQQKIVASDRASGDDFGSSVSISGAYAIVGALGDDEDASGGNTMSLAGSAYIFYNNGSTWEEQQKIVASDRAEFDYFGFSVSISGAYAIVGAYQEDEDTSGGNTMSLAGSAYIFKNNGASWEEQQKIVASDRAADDYFGSSVCISGDYAIVGAYWEDEDASGGNTKSRSGSAYVFYNNGTTWEEQQKIVASDRAANDNFGSSVCISGDYAIVGAQYEGEDASGGNTKSRSGSAYIFKNNGSTWEEQQKIVASDRASDDNFGFSVAISGDYAIVGTYQESEDASGGNTMSLAGSAYIFKNNPKPEINIKQNTTPIFDAGSFDFGNVDYGNTSGSVSFTIENTGIGNLILSSSPNIEISGTNVVDFSIVQTSVSSPVLPADSTDFSITFTPVSGGLRTAEISIANNDPDENPYTFSISGTCVKADQTITFDALADKTYGNTVFSLTATASSGLTVSYESSNTDVATVSGNTVTIIGAGTCDIRANQAGNTNYNAATQVAQSLTVNQKELTVTNVVAADKVYDGNTDAAITGSTLSGVVSGDDVTLSDAASGTFVQTTPGIGISVSTSMTLSGGDAGNYTLTQPTLIADITEKALTITAENKSKEYDGTIYSPFTVSYSGFVNGEDETDLSGTLIFSGTATTATDVGTAYVITPAGLSSTNYDITFENGSLDITQAAQSITFDPLETKVEGDAPFELTASSTSGLSISYTSSDTDVATISGSTVTIVGSGTTNITASQSGNDNFSPALAVEQMLTVNIYIAGDTDRNGSIDGTEIAGDTDGNGSIEEPEKAGDTNGNGSIDGTEISGDTNGSGSIDGTEISGDTDGSGSIDGIEISGDADGSGSIDGTEISGDTNGNGSIDGTEISGDTNGSGSIDETEVAGDTDGSGSIDGIEITGDVNGDGSIDGTEISGDADGSGSIDGTEITGDVNGNGSIDGTEISGDTDGNGTIDGTEISGDADGSGSIDGTEISGDADGSGSIDGTEIAGDTDGSGSIDGTEISGDTNGNGSIEEPEKAGDTDGSGSIDGTEISGDADGSGSIDGTEIAGDTDGSGSIDGTEISGDADGSGSIDGTEISGDTNGNGIIDGDEIANDIKDVDTGNFEVTMYPNPARGIVNLDITTTKAHEVTLTVIDITGRALLQKQFSAAERITFDMLGKVSGIYFVKLDFEGKQVLKKLVVD